MTIWSAMPISRATATMSGSASMSSLLSMLTKIRSLVTSSISRRVGMRSPVASPVPAITSRHFLSSASVRVASSPLQVELRSSQLSWNTTNSPSLDFWMSSSTISTPRSITLRTAAIEFSGWLLLEPSIPPPRCATTITWSRQRLAFSSRSRISPMRLPAWSAGGCIAASTANAAPRMAFRTRIAPGSDWLAKR